MSILLAVLIPSNLVLMPIVYKAINDNAMHTIRQWRRMNRTRESAGESSMPADPARDGSAGQHQPNIRPYGVTLGKWLFLKNDWNFSLFFINA
jgi:hypothetical protein